MNVIDIIILIVTVYLVYIMVKSSVPTEHYGKKTHKNKKKHKKKRKHIREHMNLTPNSNNNSNSDDNNNLKFSEIQFHNDYMEINTAIVKMSDQKQLFNTADIPVNYTKPSAKKVDKLIKYFIRELNSVIKSPEIE